MWVKEQLSQRRWGGAARAKAQRWEVPESGEKGKRRQRVRQSRKDGAAQSRGSAPGCS